MGSLTVGIVCEGPTDYQIILGLLLSLVPEGTIIRPLALQPEISDTHGFGVTGTGWKGVLKWCETVGVFGGLDEMLDLGTPIDLLVIHVDAGIARESELDFWGDCYPLDGTVKNIKSYISEVMEESDLLVNDRVAFCIPSDNTEAWVLAAFDPELPYIVPLQVILNVFRNQIWRSASKVTIDHTES